MTAKARLRVVPTIEFEPEEGQRLRRSAAEAGLENAAGAEHGSPPWSMDLYNLQMASQISITLLDRLFDDVRHLTDLTGQSLREELAIDELAYILHHLKDGLEALQPN